MRDVRSRAGSALALLAAIVLATAAWSRPHAPTGDGVRVTAAKSSAVKTRTPFALGWIAAFWNDGSCHGYPDVMEMYVLYGDSATNTWDSWEDIGQTDGTDSCSNYHEPTWYGSPGWNECDTYSANGAGCPNFDGHVQGNSAPPNASTTWTPDDGICDGGGCYHILAANEVIRAANRSFMRASLSGGMRGAMAWPTLQQRVSARVSHSLVASISLR